MGEDVTVGTEDGEELGGGEDQGEGEKRAECGGEPEAVDASAEGCGAASGSKVAGDGCCGGVGEENAQPHGGGEDRGCECESGEFAGSEPSYDGGVDEDEEGFGDQCGQ